MTFDDALQVLGIDVTASRKAARRAYLRLIKVHKPDRDPEGFQRVRAAFELVDDQIEWRQMYAAPDDAIDEPIEGLAAALAFDAELASGKSLEDLGVDLSGPTTQPEPPSDAPESATPPADSPVFWSSQPPAALMREARNALDADDEKRAEATALEAFEAARQAPNATPPSAYDALHVCILLYAKGHARRGRAVGHAFTQWLHDSGAERELLNGWTTGRLAVLHALLALPSGLHSTPLGVIAAGLLDNDVNIEAGLFAFAQDKPFASLQVREALERYAPNLAEAWAGAMRRGEEATHKRVLADRPWQPTAWRRPDHVIDDPANLLTTVIRLGLMLLALYWMNTTCDSKPPASESARVALDRAIASAYTRRPSASSPPSIGEGTPFWQRIYPSSRPKATSADVPIDWSKNPKWLKTFCEPDAGSKCARAQGMWAAFKAGKCTVAKQRYAWLSSDMMLTPKMHKALKVGGRTIKAKCADSPLP